MCDGDDAIVCSDDGASYARESCDLGCNSSPAPHCAYIEPRYVPNVCDTPAIADALLITSSGTLDPNLDSNCNGGILPQAGATDICIFHYKTISILQDQTLRLIDTPPKQAGRVVAMVADDDLSIEGTLDISAHGSQSGPGGGLIESGGFPKVMTNNQNVAGGGGAGGATAGAAGGSSSQLGGAANGGAQAANPAFLAALVAGAAAAQIDSTTGASFGGGGGGGVTVVSCHGGVRISGMVNAGGGGGAAGLYFIGGPLGGSGGGAGGNFVVQAKDILVTGKMFANGGGGGGGMRADNAAGIVGRDGSTTDVPAAGGNATNGEGAGGNGGIATQLPTPGAPPTTSPASPGGGGGSMGFLQTYTPVSREPTLTPSAASPPFQPNGVLQIR